MDNIRAMEGVKYVECNQIMETLQTQCEVQKGAPWNLIRTTVHEWDIPPNVYKYNKEGMFSTAVGMLHLSLHFVLPSFLSSCPFS